MNTGLARFFAVCIAFLALIPTQVLPATAADSSTLLLGVGDSLMAGVGASLPDERGEFALFADLARTRFGPNLRTANVSVYGETSGTLLTPRPPAGTGNGTPTPPPSVAQATQIDRARAELDRLPAGTTATVLLSIGGNDLLAARNRDTATREAALGTFRTNFDTILTRLQAGGHIGTLLIQTVYEPFGSDPAAMGSDAWWTERLNGTIREIAAAHPGAVVVELANAVRGNEDTLTLARYGDIHLANAGHRLAADLLWAVSGNDRTPPTITLVSPVQGNTPRPVVTVRAVVTDDSGARGIIRVALVVDGTDAGELLPRPDLAPDTYLGIWDGRTATGPHTIGVVATDRAGNRRDATASVTFGAVP